MTVVVIYNRFYFNDFMKAHEKNSETSFYRDSNEKYNGKKSYCIENKDYNDSLFFKTIDVEKDTPYKVTCMIKTENVEVFDKNINNSEKITFFVRNLFP